MLAIDDYLALAVFAISLDSCDHLWGFRFSFFDRGRVPLRIVTTVLACPYRDAVVYQRTLTPRPTSSEPAWVAPNTVAATIKLKT